jgi:hypothetical protein
MDAEDVVSVIIYWGMDEKHEKQKSVGSAVVEPDTSDREVPELEIEVPRPVQSSPPSRPSIFEQPKVELRTNPKPSAPKQTTQKKKPPTKEERFERVVPQKRKNRFTIFLLAGVALVTGSIYLKDGAFHEMVFGQMGSVRLKINPKPDSHTFIFVDGKPQPFTQKFLISFDMTHQFTVARDGYEPESKKISILSNDQKKDLDLPFTLRPVHTGFLSIRSTSIVSETPYLVSNQNGEEWTLDPPINDLPIPSGNYTIHSAGIFRFFSKIVTIHVAEGQRALVVEDFLEIPFRDKH